MSTPKPTDPIRTRMNRIGQHFLGLWSVYVAGRSAPMWGATFSFGDAIYDVEPQRTREAALDGVIRELQTLRGEKLPPVKDATPLKGVMMGDRIERLGRHFVGVFWFHIAYIGKSGDIREISYWSITMNRLGHYDYPAISRCRTPAAAGAARALDKAYASLQEGK